MSMILRHCAEKCVRKTMASTVRKVIRNDLLLVFVAPVDTFLKLGSVIYFIRIFCHICRKSLTAIITPNVPTKERERSGVFGYHRPVSVRNDWTACLSENNGRESAAKTSQY